VTIAPAGGESGRLIAHLVPRQSSLSGGNGAARLRQEFIDRLRTRLRAKLPDYMVPAEFVILRELPQTPNGKIDRHALPSPDHARADDDGIYIGPGTPLEEVLVGMWAEVLDLDRVGINDSFFELGGHSLLAARLISRVRDRLKTEVPLQSLFRSPTPAQFAATLLANAENRAAVLKVAKLLSSVSKLSDAEVKQMLAVPGRMAHQELRS
jgi:acyl carrier protein